MNILIFTLLPIVFMFHDFEEIIFFKLWLIRDKDYLNNRFKKIGPKIFLQYSKFSTSAFAFMVAIEFIAFSVLTYVSIIIQNYYIWFTIFIGFSVHIVIHIIQWMLYRKYIPAIVTSFLSLPYCIYGLIEFINYEIIKIQTIVICVIIGSTLIIFLRLIHLMGEKFTAWEKR